MSNRANTDLFIASFLSMGRSCAVLSLCRELRTSFSMLLLLLLKRRVCWGISEKARELLQCLFAEDVPWVRSRRLSQVRLAFFMNSTRCFRSFCWREDGRVDWLGASFSLSDYFFSESCTSKALMSSKALQRPSLYSDC